VITLELTGTGPTRAAALREAVTLGIDALVAQIIPGDTWAAWQVRQAIPDSLAQIVRISREEHNSDVCCVTANVTLSPGTVERAVLEILPALARRRIAVLVPEEVESLPHPNAVSEAALCQALTLMGLHVPLWPPRQLFLAREYLRDAPLPHNTLTEQLDAAVLVTGKAAAQEERRISGGPHVSVAHLEVQVINLASRQTWHTQTFQANGTGMTDQAADQVALGHVGHLAGTSLAGTLLRLWQTRGELP